MWSQERERRCSRVSSMSDSINCSHDDQGTPLGPAIGFIKLRIIHSVLILSIKAMQNLVARPWWCYKQDIDLNSTEKSFLLLSYNRDSIAKILLERLNRDFSQIRLIHSK